MIFPISSAVVDKEFPVRKTEYRLPTTINLGNPRVKTIAWINGLAEEIRRYLVSSEHGIVVLEWPQKRTAADLKGLCLLVAKKLGRVLPETKNTDGLPLPVQESVEISLDSENDPLAYLRHFADPKLAWPLHTDRALHKDVGDFLMVAKLEEKGGEGGRIRWLHLNDWQQKEQMSQEPLLRHPLTWKGDVQMASPRLQTVARQAPGIVAPIFEEHSVFGETIRWTDDRFRMPRSMAQHEMMIRLANAFCQEAERVPTYELPVGGIYIVNNRKVLHGREGFIPRGHFKRRILRICGNLG